MAAVGIPLAKMVVGTMYVVGYIDSDVNHRVLSMTGNLDAVGVSTLRITGTNVVITIDQTQITSVALGASPTTSPA